MSNDVVEIGVKLDKMDVAKPESRFAVFKSRLGLKCAVAATGGAGMVSAVSADTINWTSVIDMIEGAAGIFPSIGNMVVSIAPTLILLGVIGFILMFFDAILGAIYGAFAFFGRR